MDKKAKLWNVETAELIATLNGHNGEIVSLNFNAEGDTILTGSFDNTAKVWDTKSGICLNTLHKHTGEISCT